VVKIATFAKPETVSCNPKEQKTVQKLTNRQTTKKPPHKMAHTVLPNTRAYAQKTERAIFIPNALKLILPKDLS